MYYGVKESWKKKVWWEKIKRESHPNTYICSTYIVNSECVRAYVQYSDGMFVRREEVGD